MNPEQNTIESSAPTLAWLITRFCAAAASGFLLYASFPPLEWAPAAWAALVPLLAICFTSSPSDSFKWGFFCGCVFWLQSISWISNVTLAGYFALSLYCALYIAGFCWAAAHWARLRGIHGKTGNLSVLLMLPAFWTGLEFIRSALGGGFAWNTIGVSQYRNLALIQAAEWGGVSAVSYAIVLVNTAVALTLVQYARQYKAQQYRAHPELLVALAAVALLSWKGRTQMMSFRSDYGTIVVAAVQPNIPQAEKWAPESVERVLNRIKQATVKAVRDSAPDLVIWPETVVPDFVRYEGPARDLVLEMLAGGVPLLVGSMDYEAGPDAINYYNSSFLFHSPREEPQRYDKQHLVIFGEYIPFEGAIPFLKSLTPVEGSMTAGRTPAVLRLGTAERPLGVLICFEDTVARVARRLVKRGARLLVNQTNDAWFDPSAASLQQMAHCVFRCVENRVAAVRATNTGITCFIDRNGSVYGDLPPIGPDKDAPCYSAKAVFVPDAEMPLTLYTRYGDVFATACLAALTAMALTLLPKRETERTRGLTTN